MGFQTENVKNSRFQFSRSLIVYLQATRETKPLKATPKREEWALFNRSNSQLLSWIIKQREFCIVDLRNSRKYSILLEIILKFWKWVTLNPNVEITQKMNEVDVLKAQRVDETQLFIRPSDQYSREFHHRCSWLYFGEKTT